MAETCSTLPPAAALVRPALLCQFAPRWTGAGLGQCQQQARRREEALSARCVFVEMLCVLRPGEVGLRPARWWVRPCECAVGSSYIRTVAGGGRRVNRPGGRAASDVRSLWWEGWTRGEKREQYNRTTMLSKQRGGGPPSTKAIVDLCPPGCSTVVLICITCPAITVGTPPGLQTRYLKPGVVDGRRLIRRAQDGRVIKPLVEGAPEIHLVPPATSALPNIG